MKVICDSKLPSSEVTKYLFSNSKQVFQQFVNECLLLMSQNGLTGFEEWELETGEWELGNR